MLAETPLAVPAVRVMLFLGSLSLRTLKGPLLFWRFGGDLGVRETPCGRRTRLLSAKIHEGVFKMGVVGEIASDRFGRVVKIK